MPRRFASRVPRATAGNHSPSCPDFVRLSDERPRSSQTPDNVRPLGGALLASAAMDRLLHNAHVVVMDGDTYRNPPPAKKARRGNSGNGRSAAG